jgi:hypothetical protein
LLGTGSTNEAINKNENNIGNAGAAPVSAPNKEIHTIKSIIGTANSV